MRMPRIAAVFIIFAGIAYAQTKTQDFQTIQALIQNSNKDVSIEVKTTEKRTGEPETSSILIFDTYPPSVSVYINGFHSGVTPLTLRNFNPGGYRISLKKDRFKPLSFFLDLDPGKTITVKASLKEITGRLKVVTDPEDAEVLADLYKLNGKSGELPVGTYEVRVRKFGWESFSARVDILEDKTTQIEAKLLPAEFRVEDLFVSRPVFNPENPGLLGSTDIGFQVTAPGKGVLRLFDSTGNEVYTSTFPSFTSWDQSKTWNGRGNRYAFLPDGTYLIVIDAVSAAGKNSSLKGEVIIDRSLRISYRNFFSGHTGLIFSPTISGLPQGSYQVGTNLLALTSAKDETQTDNLNFFQAGGSIGALSSLEITPVLSLRIMNKEDPPDVLASLGLKYLVYRGNGSFPLSFAATAKGIFASDPSYPGFSQFPGISFGGIAQYSLGPLSLVAAPELEFSAFPIGDRIESWDERDFHVWGIGRFGLFFDSGYLITGFSTAIASKSFRQESGIQYPIHTGFEIHWLMPNTLLYLSGFVSWEYYPREVDRIFLGGGLGIIY